jgi:hypothetical protein
MSDHPDQADRTSPSKQELNRLEGAQWLPELGGVFGLIVGAAIGGGSGAWIWLRRVIPATLAEIPEGLFKILVCAVLGAIVGTVTGWVTGFVGKSLTERSSRIRSSAQRSELRKRGTR